MGKPILICLLVLLISASTQADRQEKPEGRSSSARLSCLWPSNHPMERGPLQSTARAGDPAPRVSGKLSSLWRWAERFCL